MIDVLHHMWLWFVGVWVGAAFWYLVLWLPLGIAGLLIWRLMPAKWRNSPVWQHDRRRLPYR